MIRLTSRRSGGWSLTKLAELIQKPSSSTAVLSAATSSRLRESNVNGTIPCHSFPGGARFLSSRIFRGDDSSSRSAASTRALISGSEVFSVCAAVSEVGRRSLLSAYRREVGLPVTTARQLSSSALAVEEDETVRLAAGIGYEVLGQYAPEGPRINPQAAFAVVQVGSHQFKVTPGDMIYTEKLKYADINDKLLLNKVLLMGSLEKTVIGRPTIPEAGVLAAVEEIALDAKVIVFKKKRRKNYRRTNGHRQELTRLRILQIEGIEAPASPSNENVNLEENSV